jgi:hypothetical protein
MKSSRPRSMTRINTRLETFLTRQLGLENVDFYEQDGCVQDDSKKKYFSKYAFKLLIVCNDRIYLTDNPPKNLDYFICLEDIIEIKTVILFRFFSCSPKINQNYIKTRLTMCLNF